jgi:hypothetical protein
MMDEILRSAIESESDMAIVNRRPEGPEAFPDRLGGYTKRRRIDVVVCIAGDDDGVRDRIEGLLCANPRLGVVAIDGGRGTGTLHRLVPVHEVIGPLGRESLAGAIRAGAARSANRGAG